MDDNFILAKEVLPEELVIEDIEKRYPKRALGPNACVTRFAPSPTGFMHIGGLFTAIISERLAHQSGGVFYLRIEDTDKKREVDGAISAIVESLDKYDIQIDEGEIINGEKGNYGPYKQSARLDLYKGFAKYLIEKGAAYPCFCTNEELQDSVKKQEEEKVRPGYYGKWAVCRNKTAEDAVKMIKNKRTFIIRLKSSGNFSNKIKIRDLVKGELDLSQNDMDAVLIKADGYPTYHFAHIIDDHLMGTTHVVRGDEWLSSTPLHMELWNSFKWNPPQYGHCAPILKQENNSKRKLSKRKDPEANMKFYDEKGYPPRAVTEYLLNLANSNFEDWRKGYPEEEYKKFPFSLSKLNKSGALFDEIKLISISKNVISQMSVSEKFSRAAEWLKKHDPSFFEVIISKSEYVKKIFSIEKDAATRKDTKYWSDIKNEIGYFFSDSFRLNQEAVDLIKNEAGGGDAKKILELFLETYNSSDIAEQWFLKIKQIATIIGYAESIKEFKSKPEKFNGHVGNVAQVLRIVITGKTKTPDLYEIMLLLGEQDVANRIKNAEKML